jgi:uncharacterized protein
VRPFLSIISITFVLVCPTFAQTAADAPASKDDVILYLRTMHSHDMMKQVMEIQSQNMQQLFRDQIQKEKGSVPPEFDTHFKKAMDDLIKGMPVDAIMDAIIPAYQQHFSKSDIDAMNAFYSSPVGQKVLQQLPVVMQEGSQAAMPIVTKYLDEWKDRMQHDLKEMENGSTQKPEIKK